MPQAAFFHCIGRDHSLKECRVIGYLVMPRAVVAAEIRSLFNPLVARSYPARASFAVYDPLPFSGNSDSCEQAESQPSQQNVQRLHLGIPIASTRSSSL